MSGLEVTHLRKCYGEVAVVDDLSFSVAPGEIFGLIGPNGAGKSTTMMMIVGLLKSDGGSIKFNGEPFNPRNPDMRCQIGIVPQEVAVYPELTAAQNLRFFGGMYGLSGQRLKERVDYVLDLTGLTRNADHTLDTFSGGMSRRLNFGIALLHEPQFVILDEPTVGIDPQSRSNLLDCVQHLGSQGVGVLYASHYMEEIEAVCNRVAIIDRGKLLRLGTLDELLDRTRMNLSVIVASLPENLVAKFKELGDVRTESDGTVNIQLNERVEAVNDGQPGKLLIVLESLEKSGIPLIAIKSQEISLETLFLSLTGRTLRD